MNKQIEKLFRLKEERNAVILAHYYQDGTIQDVADYLGDSLYLAQQAKKTNADVILFCGVHFMAETAKILNPTKTVLVPDLNAGCSLADSAPAYKFEPWVKAHPDHVVVSYINCSAAVKAMSDIICTSSNAGKIIRSIPEDKKICFAPDKYLGAYIQRNTGRKMELWDGACQVHEVFSEQALVGIMSDHPEAMILAHPECPENLLGYADYIGSTSGILKFAADSECSGFIVLTEPGIIHTMQKQIPGKEFYTVPNLEGCACNNCPHMKLNTLDKMVAALETMSPAIELPEELRLRALRPLERMLELS